MNEPPVQNLPPHPDKEKVLDFNGLWYFTGQKLELDDDLALSLGNAVMTRDGKRAAPHGTYTRKRYYRIVMRSQDKIENIFLDIFDENGDFGHFVWSSDARAWCTNYYGVTTERRGVGEHRPEPEVWDDPSNYLDLSALADNDFCPKGTTLKRLPSLELVPFRENDFPHNGSKALKIPCPLPRKTADSPPANQLIEYDKRTHHLIWTQPAYENVPELKLYFDKADVRKPRPFGQDGVADPSRLWVDVFRGQSVPQVTFPFLGFDLRRMDLQHPLTKAGTDVLSSPPSNPGENFPGTPVFAYPRQDSMDCVRSDLEGNPWVPLGLFAEYCPAQISETHTETISSMAEQARSWSVTVGLSAGAKKMMSVNAEGGYKERVENLQEHEFKCTVTREIHTKHLLYTYIPALKLHPHFIEEIESQLDSFFKHGQDSSKLDWDELAREFGTHYAYMITCGSMTFVEMRFSEDTQRTAIEKGINLKASAQAMVGKANVGANVDWQSEWSSKFGLKVGQQDVKHFAVGDAHSPVAIFLDLRPISELLSPLFFKYEPSEAAVGLETVAPFVWYKVRESLEKYLEEKGLNQPLPVSFETISGPRFFKIAFPEFRVTYPQPLFWGGAVQFIGAKGVRLIGADHQFIGTVNPDPKQLEFKIVSTSKDIASGGALTMKFGVKEMSNAFDLQSSREITLKDALTRNGALLDPAQSREQRGSLTVEWRATIQEFSPFE